MSASPVLAVGHTGITVSDIDRSLAFYRDVLGFAATPKARYDDPMFAGVTGVPGAAIDIAFVRAPDGHTLELLCYVKPGNKAGSTLRPCDPGAMHVMFRVADIDAAVAALAKGGFATVGPIQTTAEGPAKGLKAIYARDPDGIVIELIQEPEGFTLGM